MVIGNSPFDNTKEDNIEYGLFKHDNAKFWSKKVKISEDLKDLINNLLKEKITERLSLDQVKKHQWMQLDTPSKE